MRRLTVIISVCLVMAPFGLDRVAEGQRPDYRGKTYVEIRIDNQGIILIDSAGNETMVPAGISSDGDLPELPNLPIPPDAAFNPDDYPVKIPSIRKIGQSVSIDEDEHVLGEVVVVGGNATIRGLVEGSVTATGTVRITRTGIVLGNVIGNEVIEEQGSQTFGYVTEQGISPPDINPRWGSRDPQDAETSAIVGTVLMSMLFIFTFAVAMLFRKPTDRVKSLYSQNILKALLVGFLAWILILPVFLLLCITIVGIPIAALGLPLAMLASAFLGGAAFSLFISEFVKSKNEGITESRAKKVAIGFLIGHVPSIGFFLGLILDSEAMAVIFGIAALLLTLLVITLGFGAAILTRFGTRDYRNEKVRLSVEVVTEQTPS